MLALNAPWQTLAMITRGSGRSEWSATRQSCRASGCVAVPSPTTNQMDASHTRSALGLPEWRRLSPLQRAGCMSSAPPDTRSWSPRLLPVLCMLLCACGTQRMVCRMLHMHVTHLPCTPCTMAAMHPMHSVHHAHSMRALDTPYAGCTNAPVGSACVLMTACTCTAV